MYIIGIADSLHDRSVCLLKDGAVVAGIEEERLTRVKHGLKYDAAHYSIEKDGRHIASLLKSDLSFERRNGNIKRCIDYCLASEDIKLSDVEGFYISSIFQKSAFPEAVSVPHHLAHAASAFFPSPFSEAAILTIDGAGDLDAAGYESTSFGIGRGNRVNVVKTIRGQSELTEEQKERGALPTIITVKNSIGTFYKNVSVTLGMGVFGEGKTMGLAPYGRPNPEVPNFRPYISFGAGDLLCIDNAAIFHLLCDFKKNVLDRMEPKERFQMAADLAYHAQEMTEQMVFALACRLYEEAECENLCLVGGVALNSVANYKIAANSPFRTVYLQPAVGDNGLSLGAAFWGYYQDRNQPRIVGSGPPMSPYLGRAYHESEHERALKKFEDRLAWRRLNEEKLFHEAAETLKNGGIVGWFQGRSEVGPRALGNRSILADPRKAENKDIVNARVKHRESFRPFAPAVLEEHAREYFDFAGSSPYMLFVPQVASDKQSSIPAVTHVDGSARLQTVSKEMNSKFYRLIETFYQLTGVPVVLNTSFNDKGEPIVESPEDALRFFAETDMDRLFMGPYVIEKRGAICGV